MPHGLGKHIWPQTPYSYVVLLRLFRIVVCFNAYSTAIVCPQKSFHQAIAALAWMQRATDAAKKTDAAKETEDAAKETDAATKETDAATKEAAQVHKPLLTCPNS